MFSRYAFFGVYIPYEQSTPSQIIPAIPVTFSWFKIIRTIPVTQTQTPNLLLLGFPRCGTTALAYALGKHPDIFCCEPKEPHFLAFNGSATAIEGPGAEAFSKQRIYQQNDWQALFKDQPEKYLLDASVTTISYPEIALKSIDKHCSAGTKAIVMLRDPVDRAYSSYLYNLSRGWEAGTFEKGLEEENARRDSNWQHLWFFTWLSQYQDRMRPFKEYFGDKNICYVSSEQFQSDAQATLDQIYNFLDISSFAVDTSKRINAGGKPKSQLISTATRAIRQVPCLHKIAKKVTSRSLRERIRNSNLSSPEMAAGTRERLQTCLLYTSPSPRDRTRSRMPSSA